MLYCEEEDMRKKIKTSWMFINAVSENDKV